MINQIEKVFECYTPLNANDLNLLKDRINEIIRYLNDDLGDALSTLQNQISECCGRDRRLIVVPTVEVDCNDVNLYNVSPRSVSVKPTDTEYSFNITSNSSECNPLNNLVFKKKNATDNSFTIEGIVNGKLKVTFPANTGNQNKTYEFYYYTNDETNKREVIITHGQTVLDCSTFQLSQTNVTFSAAGGTNGVGITLNSGCDGNLSIEGWPFWMNQPTINGRSIVIVAPEYTEQESREGDITVYLNGSNPQTIHVKQTGITCTVSITDSSITLNSTNNYQASTSYNVTNGCFVNVTNKPSWATVTVNNGQITIKGDGNGSKTGTVTICTSGNNCQNITITQEQEQVVDNCLSSSYNISPSNFNLTSSDAVTGKQITYTKPSNDCPNLMASTNDSWITITNNSSSPITFDVSENTSTTSSRNGSILLTKDGTTVRTITVNQPKKEGEDSGGGSTDDYRVTYISNGNVYQFTLEKNNIPITSGVTWKVKYNEQVSGEDIENNKFKVTLDPTPTFYDSCGFYVRATYQGQDYDTESAIVIPTCTPPRCRDCNFDVWYCNIINDNGGEYHFKTQYKSGDEEPQIIEKNIEDFGINTQHPFINIEIIDAGGTQTDTTQTNYCYTTVHGTRSTAEIYYGNLTEQKTVKINVTPWQCPTPVKEMTIQLKQNSYGGQTRGFILDSNTNGILSRSQL